MLINDLIITDEDNNFILNYLKDNNIHINNNLNIIASFNKNVSNYHKCYIYIIEYLIKKYPHSELLFSFKNILNTCNSITEYILYNDFNLNDKIQYILNINNKISFEKNNNELFKVYNICKNAGFVFNENIYNNELYLNISEINSIFTMFKKRIIYTLYSNIDNIKYEILKKSNKWLIIKKDNENIVSRRFLPINHMEI